MFDANKALSLTANILPEEDLQAMMAYPAGLFADSTAETATFWTCACTHPRWEKKFSDFLRGRQMGHFLPLYAHETFSGRKRRICWLPLFPGYVFVQGRHSKTDFLAGDMVVRVLQPEGERQMQRLHADLWSIWRCLVSGVRLEPVEAPALGEWCRIIAGPLCGLEGLYTRAGQNGRLVLNVEMLGMGAWVEVEAGSVKPIPGLRNPPPS
jgi:transcription antitermination factor NusG